VKRHKEYFATTHMLKLENLLIACYGISTVVMFLVMVISGGLFDSLHTVLFREISFYISPYAPHNTITIPLYRVYNFDLLMFSLLLFIRLRNVFAQIGAMYLSLSSIVSLLLVQFPLDPINLGHSLAGVLHIAVACLMACYMIVALILLWKGLQKSKRTSLLARYSFELSIVIVLAGFLTALFALLNMPAYVGLVQKLPIVAFLGWILFTALWIIRSDKRVKYHLLTRKRS
jgi:hypothetical protein